MKGYESLLAAIKKDCDGRCFNPEGCDKPNGEFNGQRCTHKYCDKFAWIIGRAKHYAEKTGLTWEDILDAWEKDRDYWYMSYYQEAEQPKLDGTVRVFESLDELAAAIGDFKFRCPACNGISSNPYACNSGLEMSPGKICDWKVYGLLRDLGKGASVYCKRELHGERIFMPLAWEEQNQNKTSE